MYDMAPEEKKAYLLLKSVIFHYHGLDEDEKEILDETAAKLDAKDELEWALNFIEEEYMNAFERARDYLRGVMMALEKENRIDHLHNVWMANSKKGYVSEMEAMAMLKLAKDWEIQPDFIKRIKK